MRKKLFAKSFFLILFTISCIIAQTGCSKTDEPVSKDDYLLDTACTISIYEMKKADEVLPASELKKEDILKVIDDTYGECRRLEKLLSKTISSSDVAKLNAAAGASVQISAETAEVISAGIKYGDLSSGAFDITISPVTALWDFHSESPKLPQDSDIKSALPHVDYHNINISEASDGFATASISDPAAGIDLGGIAKGYIGDKATTFLKNKGVTSAIINLGGNVIALGGKAEGKDFTVGVEKPFSDRTELIGSINAKNKTVVTSGIYERQFEVDGKTYHHVLSPKTGYPVDTDLDSVTILADIGHSMDADALSTICLLLGSEKGKALIESLDGYEALFCLSDGSFKQTDGMNFEEK